MKWNERRPNDDMCVLLQCNMRTSMYRHQQQRWRRRHLLLVYRIHIECTYFDTAESTNNWDFLTLFFTFFFLLLSVAVWLLQVYFVAFHNFLCVCVFKLTTPLKYSHSLQCALTNQLAYFNCAAFSFLLFFYYFEMHISWTILTPWLSVVGLHMRTLMLCTVFCYIWKRVSLGLSWKQKKKKKIIVCRFTLVHRHTFKQ